MKCVSVIICLVFLAGVASDVSATPITLGTAATLDDLFTGTPAGIGSVLITNYTTTSFID